MIVVDLEAVEPCIFNGVTPAWNNMNLHRLADKIQSTLIFAHVRAATPGLPTTETNCHPFQFRKYLWMHNGMLSSFFQIKRRILRFLDDEIFSTIQGSTDSEHSFAVFLQLLKNSHTARMAERLASDSLSAPAPPFWQVRFSTEHMHATVAETIKLLTQWEHEAGGTEASLLNFAVTDGRVVIASRFSTKLGKEPASLYFASGSSFERYQKGDYRMVQADRRTHCHLVASEPLTNDRCGRDWIPVPRNHLIVITPTSNLLQYAICVDTPGC